MQEKELKKTKQKLTFQFVGVVFLSALLLGVIFFSFRFFRELGESERTFVDTTNKMLLNITSREQLTNCTPSGILDGVQFMDKDFAEKRGPRSSDENLISFLVVNGKNQIISKSLKEDIDLSILLEKHRQPVYREDQTFVRKEVMGDTTYYFYRKINYPVENYLSDILLFTSFLVLFSIGFYIIGLYFVTNTLKPVEENLRDMTDFIHNA